GVADRLRRPGEALGELPADVGGIRTMQGESTGFVHDLFPLAFRELREAAAATDFVLVIADKTVHRGSEEPDPAAVAELEPTADEATLPPTVDGLGRDLKLFAQFVDG